MLLCVHSVIAPLMACKWSISFFGVVAFVFLPVFFFLELAGEPENPFGFDANDLDLKAMQVTLNGSFCP